MRMHERALLVLPMVALLGWLREIGKSLRFAKLEASAALWGGASWPLERCACNCSVAVNASDPIISLLAYLARVIGYKR